MNTTEFVALADAFHAECVARLEGVGEDQYYNPETDQQLFESMTPTEVIDYAIEEALDLSNYALMTYVRLRQCKDVLKKYGY